MYLAQARVQKYRSVRDSGWFDVEKSKTILVGPNEAGKTAILEALQRLNPPEGIAGFNELRDYPRSELNDLDTGRVEASQVTVVEGRFELDDDDKVAVSRDRSGLRRLRIHLRRAAEQQEVASTGWRSPEPTYGNVKNDLLRLSGYADTRWTPPPVAEGEPQDNSSKPSVLLNAHTNDLRDVDTLAGETGGALREWAEGVLHLVEESNTDEMERYQRVVALLNSVGVADEVLTLLVDRRPIFVYFNNYFRVRPLIHLSHLADRTEQNVLDDDQYDFGNRALLKLLGFTARELSDLGQVGEPSRDDPAAMQAYRDQLDRRTYKLNAASVRLTREIEAVWKPDDDSYGESFRVKILADQQYLKVVVEDDLGVDIELDQRSEGFQWLVSFLVVFFAEAVDQYDNSILLLDEPGLHLHGLKQRDFRETLTKLSVSNQLIYTTHSPFLVGPDELDRVRVVEMSDRETGTKVHSTITASDPAALLPLQEALGYDLAQSLFAEHRNLVLEGLTDYWYVQATGALLRDAGTADLREDIALVPATGAGRVVYFATILHAHHLQVAALLDSDSAGDDAAKQDALVHLLGNRNILRTKDVYSGPVTHPEIEDLLRDTLAKIALLDLGWNVTAEAAAQSARPITELMADVVGPDFSKYRLAKAYLRWTRSHLATDLTADEQTAWTRLTNEINAALR